MDELNTYSDAEVRSNRKTALEALQKVKQLREGNKFKTIQIDKKTWKEVKIK